MVYTPDLTERIEYEAPDPDELDDLGDEKYHADKDDELTEGAKQ